MTRTLALTVMLAAIGCYSPSYGDCTVACGAGNCPSGLSCDNALGVCRLPGMSGKACAAAPDDASGDSAPRDADTRTYCQMQPQAAFCHDFDSVAVADEGWATVATSPESTNTLVASTISPPNAYEAQVPNNLAGVFAEARLSDVYAPQSSTQQLVIGWDMKLAQRNGAAGPIEVFAAAALGHFRVVMTSPGASGIEVSIDNATTIISDPNVAIGQWYRWGLVFQFNMSRTAVEIFLTKDGQMLGLVGLQPVSNNPQWEFTAGAFSSSTSGPANFEYDNVVLTAN